jgi:hypothetical protein
METQVANTVPAVLLPCADGATWLVPLNGLAEIVVVSDEASATLLWREARIPVLRPTPAARAFAVLLGINIPFWALPLAPEPVVYRPLSADDIADDAAPAAGGTPARIEGRQCLVPDMLAAESGLSPVP